MKLYLPCSSKNFSLIFETESVSPKSFYQLRNFGNSRFLNNPLNASEDYLTLYSQPCLFDSPERENYPMLLEFSKESLNNFLIDLQLYSDDILPGTIFLCAKTIYFDTQDFRCIFSNPKHLRDTKINSESYKNVKTVSKYKIEVESLDFFRPSFLLEPIQVMPNPILGNEVEKDRRFNYLKGFIYGYAIGVLEKKTPHRKELYSLFTYLQNTFTNAKSQIIMRASEAKSPDSFGQKKHSRFKEKYEYTPPAYSVSDNKETVINLIDEIELFFYKLFGAPKKDNEDPILVKLNEVRDNLYKEDSESTLLEECNHLIKNVAIRKDPFALMRKGAFEFFELASEKKNVSTFDIEISERLFRSNLKKIERRSEHNFLTATNRSRNLYLTEFEFITAHTIKVKREQITLDNPQEYVLYELIVSCLLKKPRPNRHGEISRSEKEAMIQDIGSSSTFQNDFGNKKNVTPYYTDLLRLYDHFRKFDDLRYDKIESTVLLNFACFISKIDKFDELIEFANVKNVKNKELAYSFWCAFNGFAEISEKQARGIFASEDLSVINSFDNLLRTILINLEKQSIDFEDADISSEKELFAESYKEPDSDFENFVEENSISDNANRPSSIEEQISTNSSSTSIVEVVEKLISNLEQVIWSAPTIAKFTEKQKENITKALLDTKKLVAEHTNKGTEIYQKKANIIDSFKLRLKEASKKRRNADYKIADGIADELISEIRAAANT